MGFIEEGDVDSYYSMELRNPSQPSMDIYYDQSGRVRQLDNGTVNFQYDYVVDSSGNITDVIVTDVNEIKRLIQAPDIPSFTDEELGTQNPLALVREFCSITGGLTDTASALGVVTTSIALQAFAEARAVVCAGLFIGEFLAKAYGDPHLTTLDGLHYDFQAGGEFVLTESLDGRFLVQARFVPFSSISLFEAAGIRIGERVISYHEKAGIFVDNEPILIDSGTSIELEDGIRIDRLRSRYSISSPIGVNITLNPSGITVQSTYVNAMVGLLGNFDGDPKNDLLTADGRRIGGEVTLYGIFADSWRIDPEDSLLLYLDGESPDSYDTNGQPNFPSVEDFSNQQISGAETVCADVGFTGGQLLEDCIYDYLVTGDRDLVTGYVEFEEPKLVAGTLGEIDLSAEITAPLNGGILEDIAINWTGPSGKNDVLTIVREGVPGDTIGKYFRTNNSAGIGSNVLQLPGTPGNYELRYVQGGGIVLASHSIEVVGPNAEDISTDGEREVLNPIDTSGTLVSDSPLIIAAFQGDTDSVRNLIIQGEDPNVGRTSDGWTPLVFAAQGGSTEIVELLVMAGANVNRGTFDEWTPLMIASQNGHDLTVRFLLESGANVRSSRSDNWTALHSAVTNNHPSVVENLLEFRSPLESAKDGFTVLTYAAQDGYTAVASLLIDAGANVDGAIEIGPTPIYMASQGRYGEIANLLITAGANVDSGGVEIPPLVHVTALGERLEVIQQLIEAGADINIKGGRNDWTALMWAANNNDAEAIRLLTGLGADISLRDSQGRTALDIATSLGNDAAISALN